MNPISTRLTRRRQKTRPRSLMAALRGQNGAIDLASIMTGVLVIGIIGGTIAATVFAVIPWAQDNAARADLGQVRLAEGVYAASHAGGYADLATIQGPSSAAGGGGAPGQPGASISAAGTPLLPADPTRQLKINANANGFVAAEISQTGRTFYATSMNTTVSSVAPAAMPAGLSAPAYYSQSASIAVGKLPNGVAVNTAKNAIYVVNGADNSLSAVDGTTNAVVATIPVGNMPENVAVNKSTGMVYVSDGGGVTVINGSTNAVTAKIVVSGGTLAIAVNETTNTVYATHVSNNSASSLNSVLVISGATNAITATIAAGRTPMGIAVNATTNTIYVVNNFDNEVQVISGATNKVTSSFLVGSNPNAVAVDPTTNTAYVTNGNDDSLSVVDGATNKVKMTIPVGAYPESVSVDSVRHVIYVANADDNSLWVIDGRTNAMTDKIAVTNLVTVAVNEAKSTVYVSNFTGAFNWDNPGTLSVITVH